MKLCEKASDLLSTLFFSSICDVSLDVPPTSRLWRYGQWISNFWQKRGARGWIVDDDDE